MRNKKVKYELYFRSNGTESITKYRFINELEAMRKAEILNKGLKLKDYTDRKYVVAKVTREYLNE